jgi:predicted dehydrogenase
MVGQQLRFNPSYARARELIQAGELGQVWSVRSDNWTPGFRSRTAAARPNWWGLDGKRAGGGALPMFVTHHIDLFRYFIGDVKRVWGKVWTDHPLFTNSADDRAVATLEFENGAIGHVSTSYSSATPHHHQIMVFGDQGTISTMPEPGSGPIVQHQAPAMVSSIKRDGAEPGHPPRFVPVLEAGGEPDFALPFVNEMLHFAECIREGKEPISSGRDNLGTMKAIFGIYESSRTGVPVDLDTL